MKKTAKNKRNKDKRTPLLEKIFGQFSPWRIQLVVLGGIAIAEIIAMVFVYFFRHRPYYEQVVLDATIMMMIITPLLYILTFRPLLNHIQKSDRAEKIIRARLSLMQYANTHSVDELLQMTLDDIQSLIGSSIGFFHFLNDDQTDLSLQSWSTNTVETMCDISGKGSHYPINKAGIWTDCVRTRKPVIHNDYPSIAYRKGLPQGHAAIINELIVPIIRNEKIVAILGTGNKPQDFTPQDVELVSNIADFAWDVIEQKKVEIALSKSEEKFRTLVNWTLDWEIWIDPQGSIVYTSPSCEKFTGYTPEEFLKDPNLLFESIHPDDRELYRQHHSLVHDETAGIEAIEYRVAAHGRQERWIEHICRPLFDAENRYLGRRISNRDITERKRNEKDIETRNRKEKLLTQRIHNIQLDIARDLHDTIGQNANLLRLKLEHLSTKCPPEFPHLQQEIKEMYSVAEESCDLVRGTLAVLQTQTSEDLFHLFRRYAFQVAERAEFQIDFTNHGDTLPLSAYQLRQLFYIFREMLNNIEKHASASKVEVSLNWQEDTLSLSVTDYGKGFDLSNLPTKGGHYGLRFMRERVEALKGTLSIETALDKGTHLSVKIPCQFEEVLS